LVSRTEITDGSFHSGARGQYGVARQNLRLNQGEHDMKSKLSFLCIPLLAVAAASVASAGVPDELAALQAAVAALQAVNANLAIRISALTTSNAHLAAQVAAINSNSVLALNGVLTLSGSTALFSGVNVQIVNGLGSTQTINGLGNLIVGYNETSGLSQYTCSDGLLGDQASCVGAGFTWGQNLRGGSHNLVVGPMHSYTQFAGFVAGENNVVSAGYASVCGGGGNNAANQNTSISGGIGNRAVGGGASVSGGNLNVAYQEFSSVSGGYNNTATGAYSSISGGQSITESTPYEWAAGTLKSP
jgi:hypothetical protein